MPKQRQLDADTKSEVGKVLQLRANKQLVQAHCVKLTGKAVTLKDIHNIAQRAKPGLKNDIQELLLEMKKVEGTLIEANCLLVNLSVTYQEH